MLQRLIQAIESKGIKKHGRVTLIHDKTGINTSTVSRVLSGTQEINEAFLKSVCIAYGINEDWVKTGEGEMFKTMAERLTVTADEVIERMKQMGIQIGTPTGRGKFTGNISPVLQGTRTVPVISKVQAGDFGFWEDQGDASEHIECPADITDPHAFAFQVEGDSMYPRYMSGEYVIVDTTKPVQNNDDVVVRLHDGAVMVKRYKYISGMVFLES